MNAEREGLADLLAEHDYRWSSQGAICLCGFVPTVDASALWTQQDYHRHHLADLLAARDRRVRAEALRPLRDGIWELGESIYGDEGAEHNEGCMGEPDCLACIVASLRRLLETTGADS